MKTPETAPGEWTAGSTLAGRYRIAEQLGRGGMGTVYRAEDIRLSRHVAIKVLPEDLAFDPARLARFDREARLLATLSHPNIATIHGIEESDGRRFLVLELAAGRDLRDRLQHGPLPIDEALATCRQIADGLEAAHGSGIIHRDLKPGNVVVSPEGKVKILDFGLAKALVEDPNGADIAESPTLSAQMTEAGLLLGTAAYMSPEQARGRAVDKRADVWAFGCVLYECLTGQRAFEGDTVTDTLALVLRGEPAWDRLPPGVPAGIRTLLRRCLRKEPENRLHDIADARIEIDEAGSPSAGVVDGARGRTRARLVAAGALAFVAGALIGAVVVRAPSPPAAPAGPVASVVKLEPGLTLDGRRDFLEFGWPSLKAIAISGDGQSIVYCAGDAADPEAQPRLFLRRMGELDAEPITGTDGGTAPFLSPDDRWVGFSADGKLKKVPIEGGIAQELCEGKGVGASWGATGRIVFADDAVGGLLTVAASGGDPVVLTTPDASRGEEFHRLPSYLPGDRGVLFTVMRRGPGTVADLEPRLAVLDLATGERRPLIDDASDARYLPTGHVAFLRRGALWAIPFDLRTLTATGPGVPLRPGVMHFLAPVSGNTTAGQYSVSGSGHLIFAPGGVPPAWVNSLAWVDREGRDQPAGPMSNRHYLPRLSPDATKIAFQIWDREQIWIYDARRDVSSPLVTGGFNGNAVWTPDGSKVIYRKILADGSAGVYSVPVAGVDSGEELLVAAPPGAEYVPTSVSPDGRRLALVGWASGGSSDILIYDFETRISAPFRVTPDEESCPSFSPDGRWMLYVSDREGRHDVYVSPASGSGGAVMVSTDGGQEPAWARSGRWIFYRTYDRSLRPGYLAAMWAVEVRPGAELSIGKPRLLFETDRFGISWTDTCWDVSPDDERFLMVRRDERPLSPVTELVLVQNWFEEVERLIAARTR